MDKINRKGFFSHYFFISPGSDYANLVWNDLSLVDDVTYYNSPIRSNNKIIQVLHHFHFSFRFNSRFTLPFQRIWRKQFAVSEVDLSCWDRCCVIYTDIAACRTEIGFLKSLSEKSNITLVLSMVNVVESKKRLLLERFKFFDYIFSWDEGDVDKYSNFGIIYSPVYFSKFIVPLAEKDSTDCFFVGSAKGRLEVLQELYKSISDSGGNAEFYITGVKKKNQTVKGIHYNKRIPYALVQKKNSSTNCIIEVIADNQVGETMRTMEAIIGNKKLLTNNKNITKNKYYNPNYMKYFSEIGTDEIAFVLEKKEINYHYDYEFSPIKLLDLIDDQEIKKK